MEQQHRSEYVIDNDYFTKLGEHLKDKSQSIRSTVELNTTFTSDGDTTYPSETAKRAYKMQLIAPNKILPKGKNKKVLEILQQKESKYML